MSPCLKRSRRAFDARRTPSMIDAWLSSSETIAEPSSQIVGKSPVLAFQHETYAERRFGAEELRDALLERAMDVERSADEAHRRGAGAVIVESALSRLRRPRADRRGPGSCCWRAR